MDLNDYDSASTVHEEYNIAETVADLVESNFGYQFIRSPSKRKFFSGETESVLEQSGKPEPNNLGQETQPKTAEMENLSNEKKENTRNTMESNQVYDEKMTLESKYVSDVPDRQVYEPTTTPVYNKLQFSSLIQKSFDEPEKSGVNSEEPSRILYPQDEDTVQDALLQVFFSSFSLIFSFGMFYSHFAERKIVAAKLTLLIMAASALVLTLSYLFNRKLKKSVMWKTSKIFTLITLIPGLLPLSLALADLVFTLKETRSRSYIRPWSNTRPIYLVESLFLVFPQALLQCVLLLEDVNSIPSVKGFLMMFGAGALILGMTFARVRFDSDLRPGRFGSGIDKYIRCTIVSGNKGLWVITYVCLVVSVRIRAPDSPITTLIALAGITLLFEVPILLPALQCCARCVAKASGMFFFIPQFASLLVVIVWTNTDLNIYSTNVGICALGAYTLFESLALGGWLLDSCSDREMDILPIYPHFLGDLYSSRSPKQGNVHGAHV